MRAGLLLLALASCGEPSSTEEAVVIPRFTVRGRWEDPTALTWRIDAANSPLSAPEFAAIVARGLDVWAETDVVGFKRASDADAADVLFAFELPAGPENPSSPFGRDTSVAVTGPVGPGCRVSFDAGRPWEEAQGAGASLLQAVVHEAGHVLGLGHSVDARSVLHPQRERAALAPAAMDFDGLHSLYGGGRDGRGDLVIEGRDAPVLRRVAPPAWTDWTLFDADGDGDDELLVWARAEVGAGALTLYHFAAGPQLERTVGPVLGFAGHGAEVECVAEPAGRFADVYAADGTALRWRFDDKGFPRDAVLVDWREVAPGPTSRAGDLDGDGAPESVTARR